MRAFGMRAFVLGLALGSGLVLAGVAHAEERTLQRVSAESCKDAVSQSRMLCVSGARCVREIGLILRACATHTGSSCAVARDQLRDACGRESDWYGSRDCHKAVQEVGARCAR